MKTKLNALERTDKGELVKDCCPVTFGEIKEWNKI